MGSSDIHLQDRSSLLDSQTGVVSQFDKFGYRRIFESQIVQGLIDREKVFTAVKTAQAVDVNVLPLKLSAVLQTEFTSRILNKNTPHGLSGSGKEMAARIPMLSLRHVNEPNVRLVYQRRGLKRLAGLLLRKFLVREAT